MATSVIFGIIGTAAAVMTSTGFVPQIIKGIKSGELKDVSLWTLGLSAGGTFLWAVYGFYLNDIIIIAANIFTCATVLLLIIMKAALHQL